MKNSGSYLLVILFILSAAQSQAQVVDLLSTLVINPYHQTKVEIFYNGSSLRGAANEDATLFLGPKLKGSLSVSTKGLGCTGSNSQTKIPFKLAIKDAITNTMWMYSSNTYQELELGEVMQKCKVGDTIYFLLTDREYKLSQNQILVKEGC